MWETTCKVKSEGKKCVEKKLHTTGLTHGQSLWRPQSHVDEMCVGGVEGGGQRTPWWPIWDCSKLTLLSWRSAQCTGSTLDCPNEETCDVNRAGKAALYASSTLFTLFGISETAPCLRLFSWGHQCAAGVQPRAKIQEEKKQGQWVPGKKWQLNMGGF